MDNVDKIAERAKIERQLVPRLKILGLILLSFSLFTFGYSLFPQGEAAEIITEEEILAALSDPPPLNSFMVASVLGIVGIACLVIAWRKKNVQLETENIDR